ncbi:iron-sulfur cluster repair protein YtfE [Marinobacteraceae bacterium S3BR75-40.1]
MTLLDQSMGNLARDIPGATAVFHRFKLDFCCGGARSLRSAAEEKGLNTEILLAALERLQERGEPEDEWAGASVETLIEHILTRYHDVHREQLPELIRLAKRVERVHGGNPECPAGLAAHLETMAEELEQHMAKEEQILFPMINRGVGGMAVHPIRVMRTEHDDHGKALERLDQLTGHYRLPEGACNTWQALYRGLQSLRNDLMDHIHLENNVLFTQIDGQLGGAQHG